MSPTRTSRTPTRQQLLARLAEMEMQAGERERLLLDLEVHREEVRLQNERLQETQRVLEESRASGRRARPRDASSPSSRTSCARR